MPGLGFFKIAREERLKSKRARIEVAN